MAPSAGSSKSLNPDSSLFKSFIGVAAIKKGYEGVDRDKIAQTVYDASKDSLYFTHQQKRDVALSEKCKKLLEKKQRLEQLDTTSQLLHADRVIARLKNTRDLSQSIVHIDCDAFYASVEQVDHPELKDVPFAVGDTVVAACNYIARKSGCRAGMVIAVAKKMCPNLTIVKPNMARYGEVMQQVCKLIEKYDPGYEICGTDEAYLNITRYCDTFNISPFNVTENLRQEIRHSTGLAVAAGIAANIQLAKISSTFIKPDGQYLLPSEPDTIMAFIENLPVRKVTGIGHTLDRQLASIGVATCKNIFSQRQFLRDLFGDRLFEFLIEVYLGCGRTELQASLEREKKSAGVERTFKETSVPELIEKNLRIICEELEVKLKGLKRAGQTLAVNVKMNNFESYPKQKKLSRAISSAQDIFNHSVPILRATLADKPHQVVRLLGVKLTQLVNKDYTLGAAFQRMTQKETVFYRGPTSKTSVEEETTVAGKRKFADTKNGDSTHQRKKRSGAASQSTIQADSEQGDCSPLGDLGNEATSIASDNAFSVPKSEIRGETVRCPICDTEQSLDNVIFNQHIDLCLSLPEIERSMGVTR